MKTAYTYNIIQRWIFAIAVVVMVVMNFLSGAIPFGGQTMAEVSQKYPTLITPAGYAFAIWGLIYLSLAIFAFFQLTKGKRIRLYKLVWPYFLVSAVANVLWLIAFQNEWFEVSVILIFALLGSLIFMFRYFYRLRRALSTTHRFFFQVPFSLYMGWVSLASIVNVAVLLTSFEIAFLADYDQLISIAMISIAAIIGLWLLLSQSDYIFNFALVWGLVAIWVKQDATGIITASKFAAIGLVAAMLIYFIADRIKISQYGRKTTSQAR
ncbi:MAG: tryptophan-rich sensory protein [Flavobacteriales bacterium]|nr:tryptophan-rich sensory protein [Flavobacteriales bacterium]